ncbi:MAG: 4Fe-4S binding protein, partial [Christensenellales bacterium]
MAMDFLYPDYEVQRNYTKCIGCRICEKQCANQVHWLDEKDGLMKSDDQKCVNCHRCVCLCPTHALKIVKTDHTFKANANWTGETIEE